MDYASRNVHAPVADTIAILDEKLAKAEDDVRRSQIMIIELRKERNALQPVSRFPPEIFLLIFKYLHPKYTSRKISDCDNGGWLIITKVCFSWRSLAIRFTEFWNELRYFDDSERIDTYSGRSQNRELDIYLNETNFSHGAFSIVKRLMERAGKLVLLCADNTEFWMSARALFSEPDSCSHLRELLFSAGRRMRISIDWMTGCTFPNNLDKLTIHYTSFPWKHTVFRGLRILDIEAARGQWPTLGEFLDILESCNNLNILTLSGPGPQLFPIFRVQSIDLRHLNVIRLDGIRYEAYLRIFEYVHPSTAITSCCITCLDYDYNASNIVIPISLRQILSNHYYSLSICLKDNQKLRLLFRWEGNSGDQCSIQINLTGPGNPEQHSTLKIIPQILPKDILQKARETNIHLFGIKLADGFTFASLFSSINNFNTLKIKDAPLKIFARAIRVLKDMTRVSESSPHRPRPEEPQEIRFGRLHFASTETPQVLQKLIEYLQSQKASGYPLNMLRLAQYKKLENNLETELRDAAVLVDLRYHKE